MDGVFTLCRATEGCTRLDGHEDACNLVFSLRVRSAPQVMRELARRLEAGADPKAVAHALRVTAERLS